MVEPTTPKVEQSGFMPALREADEQTQFRTDRIQTLCKAAKQVLREATAHSIIDAISLLEMIREDAEILQGDINNLAEENGKSNYQEDYSLSAEIFNRCHEIRAKENASDAAIAARAAKREESPPIEPLAQTMADGERRWVVYEAAQEIVDQVQVMDRAIQAGEGDIAALWAAGFDELRERGNIAVRAMGAPSVATSRLRAELNKLRTPVEPMQNGGAA